MATAPSRGPANPDLLWHRAFYGTLKPIVRKGEVVAVLHRPDNKAALRLWDRLERATVRAHLPRRESSR